jgi:hypothetical protein
MMSKSILNCPIFSCCVSLIVISCFASLWDCRILIGCEKLYNNFFLLRAASAINCTIMLAGVSVVSVAVGYFHSCALASGGDLWCWGFNAYGQVGNGNTDTQCSPVVISVGSGNSTSMLTYFPDPGLKRQIQSTWCPPGGREVSFLYQIELSRYELAHFNKKTENLNPFFLG